MMQAVSAKEKATKKETQRTAESALDAKKENRLPEQERCSDVQPLRIVNVFLGQW